MHSVLFVCTANICRSPMAAALLRAKVAAESADWRIESAGTWAREGSPAATRTLLVMKERGLDISDHGSRSVSRELLKSFNLILTMEHGQKEAMQIEFPEVARRIYLLSEMIGQRFEIADPMGGFDEDFQATAKEIDDLLDRGLQRIRQLASDDVPAAAA
jgi:protein-tyrosine-phosphatase